METTRVGGGGTARPDAMDGMAEPSEHEHSEGMTAARAVPDMSSRTNPQSSSRRISHRGHGVSIITSHSSHSPRIQYIHARSRLFNSSFRMPIENRDLTIHPWTFANISYRASSLLRSMIHDLSESRFLSDVRRSNGQRHCIQR